MIDFEHPPGSRPMPEPRLAAYRQLVVNAVATGATPRPVGRWAVPVVVAGLLAGGSVATASLVSSKPASVRTEIRCYTEVNAAGNFVSGVGATAEGTPADIANQAVSTCADVWRLGVVSFGPAGAQKPPAVRDPKQANQPESRPIPALMACVLSDGVAAVFPGPTGTCERLGLPELTER